LREKGVAISENAVYKPITEKEASRIEFSQKYEKPQPKYESEAPVIKISTPLPNQLIESKSTLLIPSSSIQVAKQ
jgi:hypothetical protein